VKGHDLSKITEDLEQTDGSRTVALPAVPEVAPKAVPPPEAKPVIQFPYVRGGLNPPIPHDVEVGSVVQVLLSYANGSHGWVKAEIRDMVPSVKDHTRRYIYVKYVNERGDKHIHSHLFADVKSLNGVRWKIENFETQKAMQYGGADLVTDKLKLTTDTSNKPPVSYCKATYYGDDSYPPIPHDVKEGSEVQVYSRSQNRWVNAKVIQMDKSVEDPKKRYIDAEYVDPSGIEQTKPLGALAFAKNVRSLDGVHWKTENFKTVQEMFYKVNSREAPIPIVTDVLMTKSELANML